MNGAQLLHQRGQSLWLDNITRDMLDSGTFRRYVDDLAITGLTSNPTIFDKAIRGSRAYDDAIRAGHARGHEGEDLFFDLALADLTEAALVLRAVHDATGGVDGWVSLEVSPLLAADTSRTIEEARQLHRRAGVPNLFIKVPGTPEGVPAIEELTAAGVPVNVTLLFSRDQYVAAADAYLRGLERRRDAGQDLGSVRSVASVFVSRWDKAVEDRVPADLHNQLGITIAGQTHEAYRELLGSERWRSLAAGGANVQRLLWASTGTKDPSLPNAYYVQALAAPDTIDTMPEQALEALGALDALGDSVLQGARHGGAAADERASRFAAAGIDLGVVAAQLQTDGAAAFVKAWSDLLSCIGSTSARVKAGA